MSVDIFSLQALENISLALENWNKLLKRGLEDNSEPSDLPTAGYDWKLRFAGYVTQQYIAKRNAEGIVRPTAAYERIVKRIPILFEQFFVDKQKSQLKIDDYALGSIPTLHSIVPMAQNARAPMFGLTARDGVVGSHFLKVREIGDVFHTIADRLESNLDYLSKLQ